MSKGRCDRCKSIDTCPVCGSRVETFNHVGVRAVNSKSSTIWHYAVPCLHRVEIQQFGAKKQGTGKLAVYNGGPLWKAGYQWFNVFWGSYWNGNADIGRINGATADIEAANSYSGGLSEYNVGIGLLGGSVVIPKDSPATVSESDIDPAISSWIASKQIPNLGLIGAYNIFLAPGVTATLGSDKSCVTFCDYHDSINGNVGPFFTLEPFPCQSGCNQCSSSSFDTLTQGLSEEMVELKTDMNPGTGWVISNEEICDYCDANFVCNKISTGENVNAWYSNKNGKCWVPK